MSCWKKDYLTDFQEQVEGSVEKQEGHHGVVNLGTCPIEIDWFLHYYHRHHQHIFYYTNKTTKKNLYENNLSCLRSPHSFLYIYLITYRYISLHLTFIIIICYFVSLYMLNIVIVVAICKKNI